MDSRDMVVDSREEKRLSATVELVKPINIPGLQEAPSLARLQVQFLYTTQHQIFASTSSTKSIYFIESSPQETGWPTLIHHYEDAGKKLCGEFDLNVLLSTVDELGAKLSPFLSQFRVELEQGSEEHALIVGEVKRVGMGIGPERKNQGLFALQVLILRVNTTYHHITRRVLKGGEIRVRVGVIGGIRRVITVSGEEICSVCLDEFRIRSCIALPCSHMFHIKCIKTWLDRKKRSCPLCRSDKIPTGLVRLSLTDMYHRGIIIS